MGTLARYGLTLFFLLCALTGHSQNMRVRSVTSTFGNTNYGHTTWSNMTAANAIAAPPSGMVSLFASNNTFWSLSSAGVLTDLGAASAPGSGITNVTTARELWVGTNGDNSTAIRGSVVFPYLTLAAARTAAISGDTINVLPGTYAENDLWKGGVTWEFSPNASVQFTDSGVGNGRGLFDDQSDPGTTCIVHAPGSYFKHLQANGFTKGAFVLTHASSRLYLNARLIEVGEGTQDNVSAIYQEKGTCFAKVTEMKDVSADHTAGGARSGMLYFKEGYADYDVDYIEAAAYALWCESPSGNPVGSCYYRGKLWTHRAGGSAIESLIAVKPAVAATANTNYLTVGHVDRLETFTGGTVMYVGRAYLTCDETITQENVGHEFDRTCDFYLTCKRLYCAAGANSVAGIWEMDNHTGKGVIRFEELIQDDNVPAVLLAGTGTVEIDGQIIKCANGKGISATGAGTFLVKGFRIDTTTVNNSANNPVSLGNSYSGLVLQNCELLAPAAASSMTASVARTVAVAGTLQVNTAVSANVGISSGAVIVNTNMHVGLITLPTAGNVDAPPSGSFTLLYTNNTVYALKSSGAMVDLEAGGGDATLAGTQTFTGDKTFTGLVAVNDIFQRFPAKTIDGVMVVTSTNNWTFFSATNFNFSFSGTPVNGQIVTLSVSNYNVTADVFGTNLAGIYSPFARSNVTIFQFGSNAVETLEFEYQTNFVAAGFWKLNTWSAREWKLVWGSNVSATTNGATGEITVSASGEANTASNLGTQTATVQGLFESKSGVDLRFRSIEAAAGGGITLHSNGTTLILSNTVSAASGEANTLSSLGTGWPLPTTKSGVDLRVNSITNDVSLSSSSNANTITFSRAALTGDVTASAGANATTIANGAVTDAKYADAAAVSVKGRAANSSGVIADIAAAANSQYLQRSNNALIFGVIPDADLPTTLAGKNLTTSTATTATQGDNDTSLATTAFVATELGTSNYVTVAGTQTIAGTKTFSAATTTLQTGNAMALLVTNNLTFVSTNMIPTGNATNFAGSYNNAWVTFTMTNAWRLTGMVDVAAANLGKPWICKLRNTNGATYRVSVDAGFRRAGTNNVAVATGQNADVVVSPDGTGGLDPTNHTVQIILYDSP